MEYLQIIFMNLAIIGFIYQLVIFILFFKKKSDSKRDNPKEFLDKIYKKPSYSKNYLKNLNF